MSVFNKGQARPPSTKFTVLYSGSLSIAYNFSQILKAAKSIEETHPDVLFVIQGKGELISSILPEIRELGIKNVNVMNVLLDRSEVAQLLSKADVLILPLAEFKKPYSGMSSKLYEYQAAGKPIICCSLGVPADYVRMTNSGFVVYPGDFRALAQAVIQLKNNPTLSQTMGENGRMYVEDHASIEAVGSKMKEIFELAIRD